MPHADSSLVPSTVKTRADFWDHVHLQVLSLLDDQTSWVTNLANVSSLLYHSMMYFQEFGKEDGDPVVNWCGFYLDSCLFPPNSSSPTIDHNPDRKLLLGPFCGKPACQFIQAREGKGVCADAYVSRKALVVSDVEAYPGHIACDGDTKSEIVVPIKLERQNFLTQHVEEVVLGVMDLDSIVPGAFKDEDAAGLERIVQSLVTICSW